MVSKRIVRTKRAFEGRRALGAVVGACGVFLALGALVRYSALQALDLRATRSVQEEHGSAFDAAMIGFTNAGDPIVVPIVGLVGALALRRMGLPRAAKMVLGSLLSVPANVVIKKFWDRERPDAAIVDVAVRTAGTSFPSGHTMGATSLYGAAAVLAWVHLDRKRARLPLTLLFVALPFGVGFSRIYLGAHWLSDVVAGAALGLLVLIPIVRRYLRAIPAEVAGQAIARNAGFAV